MDGYSLKGRMVLWLQPARIKKCHGCCLACRWFDRCRADLGRRKGERMKNGKTPTLAQKKFLRSHGLLPEAWLVIKDTPEYMEVVSRAEISRCRMRQIEGAGKKPRTRQLEKEGA